MQSAVATVVISGEERRITADEVFVFGRSPAEGVVGLDTSDMGISAEAGSIEAAWGLWWVINRSRKRPLLVDDHGGGPSVRLAPQHRFVVNTTRLTVLVPGVIYTHRIEVILDSVEATPPASGIRSTGTLLSEDPQLS